MFLKNLFLVVLLFFCISALSFLNIQSSEKYTRKVIDEILTPSSLPVEFVVTGDIMLGRFVEVLMDGNGSEYPFLKVKDFLHSVSFVLGNLEGPIVSKHVPTPSLTFKFSFASTTARILKENNISVVSLGNNHALDQDHIGYADTKKYLSEEKIGYFGHPVSVGEISLLRKNINDQKLLFVGFNATWPYEEKKYEDLIKKESQGEEFVVVVIHWGDEYKLRSNATQKHLAHLFVNSGADLVVGHHPHVVQEIEVYNGKAIFYSLGNFIFDQYFSTDVKEGLLLKVALSDEKVLYELFPTISPRSQPSLMEGDAREDFLLDLSKRSSSKLQEQIQKGTIELSW